MICNKITYSILSLSNNNSYFFNSARFSGREYYNHNAKLDKTKRFTSVILWCRHTESHSHSEYSSAGKPLNTPATHRDRQTAIHLPPSSSASDPPLLRRSGLQERRWMPRRRTTRTRRGGGDWEESLSRRLVRNRDVRRKRWDPRDGQWWRRIRRKSRLWREFRRWQLRRRKKNEIWEEGEGGCVRRRKWRGGL